MKKLFFIAVISATAISASSVMASPTNSSSRNTLDVLEIQGSALHNSRAARDAFKTVRGLYALDDGTSLRLYHDGNTYVAEVSGRAPMEVVAKKNGNFIAVNGTAEFRFVQNAAGLVENVVVTKPS